MPIPEKPVWPYPEVSIMAGGKRYFCRLWPHPNGQWCAKHKRVPYYFGVWSDPDTALERWLSDWPTIVAGELRQSRSKQPAGANVGRVANDWLKAKQRLVAAGELAPETARKYKGIAELVIAKLGGGTRVHDLAPADFAKLREAVGHYAISRRSDVICQVRSLFTWAQKAGLIEQVPDFGPEFVQPKRNALRLARRHSGVKPMPRERILICLMAADPCFEAALLLGVNAGLKSTDIATLDLSMIDLKRQVIDTERHKTGFPILAPLWPETLDAIKAVAHDDPPMLRTERGLPWNAKGTDRIAKTMAAMRQDLDLPDTAIHGALRHNLRTIGGQVSRDGARRIMGQQVGDELDEIYDHDSMLSLVRRVSEHVRSWLFNTGSGHQADAASPAGGASSETGD